MQEEGATSTCLLFFDIFYTLVYTKEVTCECPPNKIDMPFRDNVGNRFGECGMLTEVFLCEFPFLGGTLTGDRRGGSWGIDKGTTIARAIRTLGAEHVFASIAGAQTFGRMRDIGSTFMTRRASRQRHQDFCSGYDFKVGFHGRRRPGSVWSFGFHNLFWRENGFAANKDRDSPVTMDPRPTLDVVNLDSPSRLRRQRRRAMEIEIPKEEKKIVSRVLTRYRRKQRRLWGKTVEDPDPYDSDYVFYCLEGTRED